MTTRPVACRCAVLIPALGAALLLGLGSAPAALAHNYLVESSPEDGEELDSAPEEITLTFNDDALEGGNTIIVTGPSGETYEEGGVRLDGETASTGLRPLDTAGEYTAAYRIVSTDGHPIEDELAFSLSEDGVAEDQAADEEEDAETTGDQDTADQDGTADEGPSENTTASDPMARFGPVAGVIAAIAIAALIIVLLVRMRNRPGQGGGSDQADGP
ncbi:copper resistance CopC family protein [Allosalinactinospora lopnorensis]|uniref:copper resistance CopC family protein n=1 Tax=Allosalinactinospora lopnorensis TaxID=1352348 RepID=UPI000623E127|nr:copper resistance CopC family protein [Allosalinactinospora lopnorensis]